jgi:NADH-quinone oxidoreductase subunit N
LFHGLTLNDLLFHIRQSLLGIGPELFLAAFLIVLLITELILSFGFKVKNTALWISRIALVGPVVLLALVAAQWNTDPGFRFGNLLFLDNKAVFFKILVIAAWLLTQIHLLLIRYRPPAELQALLSSSVLGLLFLCMATDLLSIYLCIELLSISSYLLVALSPTRKAAEGGLKYLLFGTVSSAIMLYGISLIYGLTGTMSIATDELAAGLLANPSFVMNVAVLMTLGGLLFKLSLVPFHIWTPDVYEAAPTPIVSFLSVAPKAAVLLVLMRFVSAVPSTVLPTLAGIALISITIGNVTALWQQNARRLLAYSSIAQAGYLIVGVIAYNQLGFESSTFYAAAYLLLNMGAFFLIDMLQPRSDTNLAEFAGLGRRYVVISVAITLVMVALAGLPPTVGFTAKWLVFSALWETYSANGQSWMLVLLIGGIVNAAISLVYYLRLPFLLFFRSEANLVAEPESMAGNIGAVVILLLTLILFFVPSLLTEWIQNL